MFAADYIPWPPSISGIEFTERMLCVISADSRLPSSACQGDSGGPLVREVMLNRK